MRGWVGNKEGGYFAIVEYPSLPYEIYCILEIIQVLY